MLIQCMIKRDGVTEFNRGGTTYRFEKNEKGDAVCDIHNAGHAKMLLKMGPRYYRKYGEDIEDPKKQSGDDVVNHEGGDNPLGDIDPDDMNLDGQDGEDGNDLDDDSFNETVPIQEGKEGQDQQPDNGPVDAKLEGVDQSEENENQEPEQETPEEGQDLTDEEKIIVDLVNAGETLKTIGEAIGVSTSTASKRVNALKEKLHIK